MSLETVVVGRNEFLLAWDEGSASDVHSVSKKWTTRKRSYHKRAHSFRTTSADASIPIYHPLYQNSVGWAEFDHSGKMQLHFYPEYEHLGA